MLDLDLSFLWVIINLVILYVFLRKFLFGRVTAYMDQRTKSVEDAIERGQAKIAEGEEFLKRSGEALTEASARREEIVSKAVQKAQQEYDAIVGEARKEASLILTRAREEIESERARLSKELQEQVAALAIACASKVVSVNMDSEANRKLVGDFLDEGGAA